MAGWNTPEQTRPLTPEERQRDVTERYTARDTASKRHAKAPRRRKSTLSAIAGLLSVPVILMVIFAVITVGGVLTSTASPTLGDLARAAAGQLPNNIQAHVPVSLYSALSMIAGSLQILRFLAVPSAIASLVCSVVSLIRRTASGGSILGILAFGVLLALLAAPYFTPAL